MPHAGQTAFTLLLAAVVPAALLAASPARATTLGIDGTRFTIDGRPTFLLGFSYYGALGASDEFVRQDLEDLRALGFNWFRVWATWHGYENDVSAVSPTGEAREPYLRKLEGLLRQADRRGMVVDVTLSRGNGATGPPRLQSPEHHRRAVEVLVTALRSHRNWYLDLGNERNIRDGRYVSMEDLKQLRARVRELDAERLVTASHAGGDMDADGVRDYLTVAGLDFFAPHRPRNAGSPGETEAWVQQCLKWAADLGRPVPVHLQEPFRRDFSDWQPEVEDFLTDLRGAVAGGAAGWCFHNGGIKGDPNGRPRRSFDLRPEEGRLMDQLDAVEREVVRRAREQLRG